MFCTELSTKNPELPTKKCFLTEKENDILVVHFAEDNERK